MRDSERREVEELKERTTGRRSKMRGKERQEWRVEGMKGERMREREGSNQGRTAHCL